VFDISAARPFLFPYFLPFVDCARSSQQVKWLFFQSRKADLFEKIIKRRISASDGIHKGASYDY
jgi:hypothetical protein